MPDTTPCPRIKDAVPVSAAFAALSMARSLGLPEPVYTSLEALCPRIPWQKLEPQRAALCDAQSAEKAYRAAARLLAPIEENTGLAQLAVHLSTAQNTLQAYRAAGVEETVFWDTMRCFPRFLAETHARTGRWAFDRAFWTWRQLACRLFRLGTLEFEVRAANGAAWPGIRQGEPFLSVHIPSDAQLTEEALGEAYAKMRRFFAQEGAVFCPQGVPKAAVCGTWLLSPALLPLLPARSGIRRFASGYALVGVDEEDTSFYEWLFGGYAPVDALPEKTSLQRAVKAFLAQGGKLGAARGILREPAESGTGGNAGAYKN